MPWIAPEITRDRRPFAADERVTLDSFLEFARATLLLKCAGLTAEQLALQAAPPSNLSLLGIVRHMVDVELTFFRQSLAGEQVLTVYARDDRPDAAFEEATAATAEADYARFIQECEHSRKVTSGAALDVEFVLPGNQAPFSLRRAYNHLIDEYARHNGHADLLRQSIDGSTGF